MPRRDTERTGTSNREVFFLTSCLCPEIDHPSSQGPVLFQLHSAFTSVCNPDRFCSRSKSVIISSPPPLHFSVLCLYSRYLVCASAPLFSLSELPLCFSYISPLFTYRVVSYVLNSDACNKKNKNKKQLRISHVPILLVFLSICTVPCGQCCASGIFFNHLSYHVLAN